MGVRECGHAGEVGHQTIPLAMVGVVNLTPPPAVSRGPAWLLLYSGVDRLFAL